MKKLTSSIRAWYVKHIVEHWYKTWTIYSALVAAALPDLLQIGLDHLDLILSAGVPLLDDTNKARVQLVLILLIPVVRSWKQKNLAPTKPEQDAP